MYQVNIKPLSVNEAWQGRRFKTYKYTKYEKEVLNLLPPTLKIYKIVKYRLNFEVAYSNSLCDIDNFLKPFMDILQKKYDFNDSQIYELLVRKSKVKKGEEYIKFDIQLLKENETLEPVCS